MQLAKNNGNTADLRPTCCELFFAFAKAELPIFELTAEKANLEDVFIGLTESTLHEASAAVNCERKKKTDSEKAMMDETEVISV